MLEIRICAARIILYVDHRRFQQFVLYFRELYLGKGKDSMYSFVNSR
jgi:hypothetical protein